MKLSSSIASLFLGTTLLFSLSGCDTVGNIANDAANTINGNGSSSEENKLTNGEVIQGLKKALNVGIKNAVDLTSKTDGYLKNTQIKIPFPKDAEEVKKKAIEWGMESQVDKIVTTINRAAEEASKEAIPIFVDAITDMSISDGFAILKGGKGAATNYLKDKTRQALTTTFRPKVEAAIEKVELTKYWQPVVSKYNKTTFLTGKEKVEEDLSGYITDKAIDGLFIMVKKEENKIRKDPMARVTDILKKVFGSLD